ncbi:hypothetical protein MIR68_008106 [Amoeboaphelidium protococcarum]|nr:hypothetical protein MIR68_008106 [Amoeboaphelidium protococcarum]
MQITITNQKGEIYSLELTQDTEISTLKMLVEAEFNIPAQSQQYYKDSKVLNISLQAQSSTLQQLGIQDNDILFVHDSSQVQRSQQQSSHGQSQNQQSSQVDAQLDVLRQQLLSDPNMRQQMQATNPGLLNAAQNDPVKFKQMLQTMMGEQMLPAVSPQNISHSDPFDVEMQKRIEEQIRMENINENMELAYQFNPEVFTKVHMLYVDVEVNGRHIKAFIDSGAQATIMTPACAEKCGIMHLCDSRFAGIAKGVGTSKILGRIHAATLNLIGKQKKIDAGSSLSEQQQQSQQSQDAVNSAAEQQQNKFKDYNSLFVQCSFTITELGEMDILIGLDMLRRFSACIDLEKNVLRIGEFETHFLSENELPDYAKREYSGEVAQKSPVTQKPQQLLSSGNQANNFGSQQVGSSSSASKSDNNSQMRQVTQSTGGTQQSSTAQFPDASIQSLINIGMSRDEAIKALRATNGNVEVAASMFFQ